MATVAELMTRLTARAGDLDKIVNETAATLQPASQLINTFGPLTDKLTQKETLAVASHLLSILTFKGGKIIREYENDKYELEQALASVRGEIDSASLEQTGASLTLAMDLSAINGHVQAAGDSVQAKIKTAYTTTQPKAFQALDVGLAVGATAIPYAGPLVGGFIMGGPKAAIALEAGAIGSVYSPTLSQTSDKPDPWQKGQQGAVKDVLKDGSKDASYTGKIDTALKDQLTNKDLLLSAPSSYGVGLLWWGIMRIKLGMEDSAIASAKASGVLNLFDNNSLAKKTLSQSINPQTRNQLAVASNISKYIPSGTLKLKSGQINDLVNTKSETLKEFMENTKNANAAVRKAFEAVIYIGIRNSFGPELEKYRETLNKITGINQDYRLGPTVDDKYVNVIALLIVSYFYLEGRKRQSNDFDPAKLEYSAFKIQGANINIQGSGINLDTLNETMAIQTFKSLRNFTSESLWPQVKVKSMKYVKSLKEALVNDLGQPFTSNANGQSIKTALMLYFTCAMIVVDNISRKEAGAASSRVRSLFTRTATDIPEGAIEILSDLKFVQIYSTWTGTVSDKEKREATKDGRLRYYGGKWTVKGSSRSEKMMIFVFSLIVLSVVDIVQICAGYQDWKRTEQLLRAIINKINAAEMEMDVEI